MIGASLTLGTDPFLEALKRVDEGISGFRAKIIALNQSFEGFHLLLETASEQFEHLRESLDFGSHMADLASQTGATAGDMAVLTQAFENCGLGADGASGFIARLQKALSGLNEAGAETETAFRQLGVNVMAMRRMPLLDQINALQAAFQRISNVDDRTKIAEELFGKSGAEDIRFLVNVEGMDEARDQVGGLKASLDSNARAFSSIAIALDALHLKAVQFWAGFAKALDGNTSRIANFINRVDLSGLGAKAGEITRKTIGFLIALEQKLRAFEPLLVALAAKWAWNAVATSRLAAMLGTLPAKFAQINTWLERVTVAWEAVAVAATQAAAAQRAASYIPVGGALPSTERLALGSGVRIIESEVVVSRFANMTRAAEGFAMKLRALPGVIAAAATAWATQSWTNAGFMEVAAAAWGGWKLGSWLRESIWHDKAKTDSAQEQTDITDQEGGVFNDFAERRKNLHTKEDRAALMASIDGAIKALRDRLSHEADRFSGQQLADVMRTGQVALSQLEKLGQQAAKAALTKVPSDPTLLAPWLVSGKTPVSNLGRAGGGMNMIGVGSTSSDPLLNESKRHTKLLENLLNSITGSPTASRPPVYHTT